MTKKEMSAVVAMIDEYGACKAVKEKNEKRMKELAEGGTSDTPVGLKDIIPVGQTIGGTKFQAALSESSKRIVNVEKAFATLTKAQLLKCATISVTALGEFMGKEQIDELVDEFAVTPVLRVTQLKGGR